LRLRLMAFVVMPTVLIPGMRVKSLHISEMSFRTSGSPPVSRILFTPASAKMPTR
jgi:hypothetical protein